MHSEGALLPEVSLWHWEKDCQKVSWMARLGSFRNTTQAIPWFAHEFADTQAAQNLKSANKKQIHNNSNFHFCLNIELLCIYTKYRSCPSFSTRPICRSLIFSHYPGAPWKCCCLCSKACWLNNCCCFCRNCTTSGLLSRDWKREKVNFTLQNSHLLNSYRSKIFPLREFALYALLLLSIAKTL